MAGRISRFPSTPGLGRCLCCHPELLWGSSFLGVDGGGILDIFGSVVIPYVVVRWGTHHVHQGSVL